MNMKMKVKMAGLHSFENEMFSMDSHAGVIFPANFYLFLLIVNC